MNHHLKTSVYRPSVVEILRAVESFLSVLTHNLTFSRAPGKKDFPFFPVGRPRAVSVPKTQPHAGCLFSTGKSRSEVPERGDFGEENCLGKGGVERGKKRKKDAQKKVGNPNMAAKVTPCKLAVYVCHHTHGVVYMSLPARKRAYSRILFAKASR